MKALNGWFVNTLELASILVLHSSFIKQLKMVGSLGLVLLMFLLQTMSVAFTQRYFLPNLVKLAPSTIQLPGMLPSKEGKVERKIQSFKAIIRKTVMYRQCKADEMKVVGIEAATALNQKPGPQVSVQL